MIKVKVIFKISIKQNCSGNLQISVPLTAETFATTKNENIIDHRLYIFNFLYETSFLSFILVPKSRDLKNENHVTFALTY